VDDLHHFFALERNSAISSTNKTTIFSDNIYFSRFAITQEINHVNYITQLRLKLSTLLTKHVHRNDRPVPPAWIDFMANCEGDKPMLIFRDDFRE